IGHPDIRSDPIHDGEPQRLHPQEPRPLPVQAESDQLIQPRHQQACAIFPESDHLGRFGECLPRENRRIESVVQDAGVLPECLVNHVISVSVDRRHRDMPLRLRTTEDIRAKQNHITWPCWLLPELREQDRRTITDDDDLHTVIRHRAHRPMHSTGSCQQRLVLAHGSAPSRALPGGGQWTTSTGHVACSAQAALTEPMRSPATAPWPREPTTIMDAEEPSSMRTVALSPSVTTDS